VRPRSSHLFLLLGLTLTVAAAYYHSMNSAPVENARYATRTHELLLQNGNQIFITRERDSISARGSELARAYREAQAHRSTGTILIGGAALLALAAASISRGRSSRPATSSSGSTDAA
jgi:hypothetical protein